MVLIFYSVLTVALLIATIHDIRFHKIPNWLTFPAMIAGISYCIGFKGLEGFFFSIAGLGVGIAVFIIPYLFGGTGAGDVKLMGAVGAFLGPKGVFIAFLATSIVGGIYALGLLAYHGYLKEALKRHWAIFKTFIYTKKFIYIPPSNKEQKPKLRYGVAIALGTIISMIWRNLII
jgi:prepilin peptidase CpaA